MAAEVNQRRLVAAYQEGLSLRDCARRFGLAKSTVHFLLQRWGIARRPLSEARQLASDRELGHDYDS